MATEQQEGHRLFASWYDRLGAGSERKLGPLIRPRIAGEAHGQVLEIGAGTGANFSYYPDDASVIATEPDPYMMKRARKKLAELARTNIELRQASAERLPFEAASFDHVISTLVLCSVPDQLRAFAEVRRVLKPDGTFRFLEHVRNDESAFWGTVQDLITPVWRWLGAGCHPNRRTQAALEDTGLRIDWVEQIRIAPGTPAVYGVALSS